MKRIFLFFPKQRQKDVAITNASKKKAKENLNSSGSNQQTSTASTQFTTNKDPSTAFPTQEELSYQSSA